MGKLTILDVLDFTYKNIILQQTEKDKEFYTKAYNELKSCIKIEIVNIDKIRNMELPKTPIFPQNHIIQIRDLVVVCSETEDKEGYCISIFTKTFEDFNIDSIIIDKTKYPRIYIGCTHIGNCKHANILKTVNSMRFCMKTKRVMHNCIKVTPDEKMMQILQAKYGKNTKLTIFNTYAEKMIFMVELLNKLGYYMQTEKKVSTRKYKKSKKQIKKEHLKKHTYFNPIRYIDSEPTGITRASSPKCKHIRKSHLRRVGNEKTGFRLVKVKSCVINKEKEDTTYKI
jgi:hypothetical protein